MGTCSVFFYVLKLEKLIAIKNYIKSERNFAIIIFCKLRRDFVAKTVKISYLFSLYIHDGIGPKMFLTDWWNCRSNYLQ